MAKQMSRNLPGFLGGLGVMTFTFGDIPVVTGLVVCSGGAMVFFAKGILVFGEIRSGLKNALAFMERFEKKFDTSQEAIHRAHDGFRDNFAEHDGRLGRLELATGLDGDRRHLVRRTQDQVLRDVRQMSDLPPNDS